MTERLIGYGYTNSSGVAILEYDANGTQLDPTGYTGVGAGVVDIKAKLHDDSSLVSEIYSVLDCIFKDMGTSSDYSTWTSTDFTNDKLSRNDEYTTLTPTDNWDTHNQTISDSNLCIEFDINITYTNAHYFIRFMGNGSNVQSLNETQLGLVSGEWSHVKFVRNGNQLNIIVDNVEKTPQPLSASLDTFRFMLDNTNCTDMKYKNFKIYPV